MKIRIVAHHKDNDVNLVICRCDLVDFITKLVKNGYIIEFIHLTTAGLSVMDIRP